MILVRLMSYYFTIQLFNCVRSNLYTNMCGVPTLSELKVSDRQTDRQTDKYNNT